MLHRRIEAREIPTEENLSGGRRSDRKVGKRRPRRYVWSRSVVSSEIATTVWHDGYTCTIVRWIRGHPPQTWYTHQRRAERWSRSERKSGRYEIKGDKPGLRLLGLSHEIHRVERMYYRRYYYAFATPQTQRLDGQYDRQVSASSFLYFSVSSFCTIPVPCDLFLVTPRWKLRLRPRDTLRLLIRSSASFSWLWDRRLLGSSTTIRFNNFKIQKPVT